MRRSCLLLLGLALVGPLAARASVQGLDLFGFSSPVVAWSSQAALGSGKGLQMDYQVASTEESVKGLILGALGKLSEAGESNLRSGKLSSGAVVVFLGSQLDASAMRKSSGQESLAQLDALLNAAESSVVAPYTKYTGPSIQASVGAQLKEAGVAFEAVNCGQSEDVAAGVRSALKGAAAGSPRVVLVCASAQPEHSAANLKVELAQLAAVQQAVAEQASEALFIYTAQAPQQVSAQRRSMLTYKGFGPYQVCGPLCKTQVRWLEGMLAILFMALATCAGMTCLYLLDTPSRYEVQKEGVSN